LAANRWVIGWCRRFSGLVECCWAECCRGGTTCQPTRRLVHRPGEPTKLSGGGVSSIGSVGFNPLLRKIGFPTCRELAPPSKSRSPAACTTFGLIKRSTAPPDQPGQLLTTHAVSSSRTRFQSCSTERGSVRTIGFPTCRELALPSKSPLPGGRHHLWFHKAESEPISRFRSIPWRRTSSLSSPRRLGIPRTTFGFIKRSMCPSFLTRSPWTTHVVLLSEQDFNLVLRKGVPSVR